MRHFDDDNHSFHCSSILIVVYGAEEANEFINGHQRCCAAGVHLHVDSGAIPVYNSQKT